MKTIYMETYSGVTEEMFLGALSKLSGNPGMLKKLPEKLRLPKVGIKMEETVLRDIACFETKVVFQESSARNGFNKQSCIGSQTALRLVQKADLPPKVKTVGTSILSLILNAEKKAYGNLLHRLQRKKTLPVKSFVEMMGCAWFIVQLDIGEVYSSPVCTGFGYINDAQRGRLPVPSPLTIKLLDGIPFYTGDEKGQKTTPVAAAIIKYLRPCFDVPPLVFKNTACSAGNDEYYVPHILRVSMVEQPENNEQLFVYETIVEEENVTALAAKTLGERLTILGVEDFFLQNIKTKDGKNGVMFSFMVIGSNLKRLSSFISEYIPAGYSRYYPVNHSIIKGNNVQAAKSVKMANKPSYVSRHPIIKDFSQS